MERTSLPKSEILGKNHKISHISIETDEGSSETKELIDSTTKLFCSELPDKNPTSKKCEKKGKKGRKVYEAKSNRTIALKNEIIHKQGISPLDEDFEKFHDVIKNHAYRRVQLFYAQLLFYYNENCTITRDRTVIQHGKAACPCCSAAHSAILSSLADDLGIMDHRSYLYQNMNATIEMPIIVNTYDCVIENNLRSQALELLNESSLQGEHPYSQLKLFVQELQSLLFRSKIEIDIRKDLIDRIQKRNLEIRELEKETGVMISSNIQQYAKAAYEIMNSKRIYSQTNQYSISYKLPNYDSVRQITFHSIFEICTQEIAKINTIKNQKELDKYLIKNPHIDLPNLDSFDERKAALQSFKKSFHPIDFCFQNKQIAQDISNQILDNLTKFETIEIYNRELDSIKSKLEGVKIIVEIQAEGSVCPKYEDLSGKLEDGARIPFSEEELIEQKHQLQNDWIG